MTVQEENKIANDWLLNYHDKMESYHDMLNNFNVVQAMEYSGMPGGSTVGNPCASKAMSLITMDEYKNWLIVIETVERTLSPKSAEFLRLWRLAVRESNNGSVGRPSWCSTVSVKYCEFFVKKYGKEFLPSDKTLNNWKRDMVEFTVRLAIRKNLL